MYRDRAVDLRRPQLVQADPERLFDLDARDVRRPAWQPEYERPDYDRRQQWGPRVQVVECAEPLGKVRPDLPLDDRLPAFIDALSAPGAEKQLLAVYRRQFSGANAELRSAAAKMGLLAKK